MNITKEQYNKLPDEYKQYFERVVLTGGIVLDPFAGSGTTGLACKKTGRDFILIEKEPEYVKIAQARLNAISGKQENLTNFTQEEKH